MHVFDECQDVAGCFVDGGAAAVKSWLRDDDFIAPGLAAVLAATRSDVVASPRDKDSAL